VPTLTAVLDLVGASVPRVNLTVNATDVPTAVSATVVCNESPARPVRGAEPISLASSIAVARDYETQRDTALTWTVTLNTGQTATSAAITVPSDGKVLLLHPGTPALSAFVNGDPPEEHTYAMQSDIFNPPGRGEAVYWSTGSDAATGSMTLWTDTSVDRDALVSLLRSGYPVKLLTDPAWFPPKYLGVTGLTVTRISQNAWDQQRRINVSYTLVARPVSALTLDWSYASLKSRYTTFNDLKTAYTGKTYLDVLLGPP